MVKGIEKQLIIYVGTLFGIVDTLYGMELVEAALHVKRIDRRH